MDYRARNYYLVRFHDYHEDIKKCKKAVPSLKIHEPYAHFNRANMWQQYDGLIVNHYVQHMISCKKEESKTLENTLKGLYMIELTWLKPINKEICLQ